MKSSADLWTWVYFHHPTPVLGYQWSISAAAEQSDQLGDAWLKQQGHRVMPKRDLVSYATYRVDTRNMVPAVIRALAEGPLTNTPWAVFY